MTRFSFHAFGGVLGLTVMLAGCASWEPVAGVPVTVEDRSHKVVESHASYSDGTLLVSGQLRLTPGTITPDNAHFDIRVFNAQGKLVADFPAKFVRDESQHYPRDPRWRASFWAKTKIPLDQVAKVEVTYDSKEHPSPTI